MMWLSEEICSHGLIRGHATFQSNISLMFAKNHVRKTGGKTGGVKDKKSASILIVVGSINHVRSKLQARHCCHFFGPISGLTNDSSLQLEGMAVICLCFASKSVPMNATVKTIPLETSRGPWNS